MQNTIFDGRPVMTHPPTDAQRERLVNLLEECSEVIKECSKIMRFGWMETYPDGKKGPVPKLNEEIGDVVAIIQLMAKAGDIDMKVVELQVTAKLEKLKRFSMHQDDVL